MNAAFEDSSFMELRMKENMDSRVDGSRLNESLGM